MIGTFNGRECKHLYVLLRHPAFLITPSDGTHDVTRVYVNEGKCQTSVSNYLNDQGRIGPAFVTAVVFDSAKGLEIHTTRGILWSPAADCQVTALTL